MKRTNNKTSRIYPQGERTFSTEREAVEQLLQQLMFKTAKDHSFVLLQLFSLSRRTTKRIFNIVSCSYVLHLHWFQDDIFITINWKFSRRSEGDGKGNTVDDGRRLSDIYLRSRSRSFSISGRSKRAVEVEGKVSKLHLTRVLHVTESPRTETPPVIPDPLIHSLASKIGEGEAARRMCIAIKRCSHNHLHHQLHCHSWVLQSDETREREKVLHRNLEMGILWAVCGCTRSTPTTTYDKNTGRNHSSSFCQWKLPLKHKGNL